jgi:iron complex transport system substrate-binding protein
MKRSEKVYIIIALVFALIGLVSCTLVPGANPTNSPPVTSFTTFPQNTLTSVVLSIITNPESYKGQRVTIIGYYRGWDLLHETGVGPPVTLSDWVIKDASGAIYVSAQSKGEWIGRQLDHASRDGIDTILKLTGIIRVSAEGRAYIDAERIEVQPHLDNTQAPLSFIDDTGQTIKLPGVPQRIVSLGPTITQVLVALGASEKIVGIDDFSYWPSTMVSIPRLGEPYIQGDVISPKLGIDTNQIKTLHSDLIIANIGTRVRESESLQKTGIPTVFLNPVVGVTGALKQLSILGTALGQADNAKELTRDYEKREQAVVEKVQGEPKVRVVLARGHGGGPPALGLPVADDDPLSELIQLAGGINVFTSSPEDKQMLTEFSKDPYTLEPYIAKNPEVMLVIGSLDQWQLDKPGWDKVSAVQKGRVYTIGEITPLTVINRLEEIAKLLHPGVDW